MARIRNTVAVASLAELCVAWFVCCCVGGDGALPPMGSDGVLAIDLGHDRDWSVFWLCGYATSRRDALASDAHDAWGNPRARVPEFARR